MALVVSSGQIIDITKKNVAHVTSQAVVSKIRISKRWDEIDSNHLGYILLLGGDDEKW